jgi:dynein heavy chain
MIFGGWSFSS